MDKQQTVDPDQMLHTMAFDLGLHCLSEYFGFWCKKTIKKKKLSWLEFVDFFKQRAFSNLSIMV